MTWFVVSFQNENSVEAVPKNWYIQDSAECYWPPSEYSMAKQKEFIKNDKVPETDWKHYPATILGIYGDLFTAQRKANKAKTTSDLSSNNEQLGTRRHVRRRNRRRSPKQLLSDIQSTSDSSEQGRSDSDKNEYPSQDRLSAKNGISQSLGAKPKKVPEIAEKSINPEGLNNTIQNTEFKKQLFKEVNAIQLKLNDIMENVSLLLKSRRFENEPALVANEIPDIIHSFPVNKESLNEMERWLHTDAQNKKILAQELSRIGGLDVKEVTRRIMYRVFTNEVGDLYSWEGAKKKKIFRKLAISSTILSAVRLCKPNDSTEAEVIVHIKAWLVRCKDRINNRAKANLKKNEDETPEGAGKKARDTDEGRARDKGEIRPRDRDEERARERDAGRARNIHADRARDRDEERAEDEDEEGAKQSAKEKDEERARNRNEARPRDRDEEKTRERDAGRARNIHADKARDRNEEKAEDEDEEGAKQSAKEKDEERARNRNGARPRDRDGERARERDEGRARNRYEDKARNKDEERVENKDRGRGKESAKQKDEERARDRYEEKGDDSDEERVEGEATDRVDD